MTKGGHGALSGLRVKHLDSICESIALDGPATQAELSRRLNLSRATISSLIKDLLKSGRVTSKQVISSGRRATEISLASTNFYYLGGDLDSSKVVFCLINLAGKNLGEVRLNREFGETDEAYLNRANAELDRLLRKAGIADSDVKYACVAVSSPVDPNTGELLSDEFFRDWDTKRLIGKARQVLKCPISLENDATAAAIGQKYAVGGYRDVDNMIVVIVDQGIGAGLIIGGKVHSGQRGLAGEIGHVALDNSLELCRCGNVGCVETVASVRAVVQRASRIDPAVIDIADVLSRIDKGDIAMERLVSGAGSALGKSLIPLINAIDPEIVLITGSPLAVHDSYMNALQAEAAHAVRLSNYPRVQVQAVTDWEFGIAKGAAICARAKDLAQKI